MKKISSVLIVIIAILFLIVGCRGNEIYDFPYIEVETSILQKKDISLTTEFNGVVESENTHIIQSDCMEKVKDIKVKIGSKVEKGDIICTIDTTSLEETKKTIKEKLNIEKKKFKERKIDYEDKIKEIKKQKFIVLKEAKEAASTFYKQYKKLKKVYNNTEEGIQKYTTYEQMMDMSVLYEEAKQNIEDIKLSQKQEIGIIEDEYGIYLLENDYITLKKEYNEICRKIKNKEIISDMDGIITEIYIERNEVISGSIAKIADMKNLNVIVSADSSRIYSVKEGMNANITCEVFKGKSYAGVVENVLSLVQDDMFTFYVSVPDESELLEGMNVNVKIERKRMKNVLAIEKNAIYKNDNNQDCILVVREKEGKKITVEQIVNIIEETDNEYLLEDNGMIEGAVVVLNCSVCSAGDYVNIIEK